MENAGTVYTHVAGGGGGFLKCTIYEYFQSSIWACLNILFRYCGFHETYVYDKQSQDLCCFVSPVLNAFLLFLGNITVIDLFTDSDAIFEKSIS